MEESGEAGRRRLLTGKNCVSGGYGELGRVGGTREPKSNFTCWT